MRAGLAGPELRFNPDPKALLDWFHEQNLYVTLNVHPADGVGTHEDM